MTKKRKIFIDCGMNMGTGFSKLCNTVGVDENWEIFGFEPNEYAFDISYRMARLDNARFQIRHFTVAATTTKFGCQRIALGLN